MTNLLKQTAADLGLEIGDVRLAMNTSPLVVQGLIVGALAVTPSQSEDNRWSITHIETGGKLETTCGYGDFVNTICAVACARRLAAGFPDWTFRVLEQMPQAAKIKFKNTVSAILVEYLRDDAFGPGEEGSF